MGFHRLYPFGHIEEDPEVSGVRGMDKLPALSTFWRYVRSLGINQTDILDEKVMQILQSPVESYCKIAKFRIKSLMTQQNREIIRLRYSRCYQINAGDQRLDTERRICRISYAGSEPSRFEWT